MSKQLRAPLSVVYNLFPLIVITFYKKITSDFCLAMVIVYSSCVSKRIRETYECFFLHMSI
jgi:hypothetical protein